MKTQHIIQTASWAVLAASLFGTQANALTVNAEVTYTPLVGSSTTRSATDSASAYKEISSNICGADCWIYAESDSLGSSIGAYANTHDSGSASSVASFTDSWTNTSGQTQSYSFDFFLTNTNIALSKSSSANLSGGFAASILVNGSVVWNTSRTVSMDAQGTHISTSGSSIDSGLDSETNLAGNYNINYNYFGSVNIGSFASGQSFTVQYILSSFTTSTNPDNCLECQRARATIFDPYAVNAQNAISVIPSVPEPETYALMLAGLGLVAATRRRLATR